MHKIILLLILILTLTACREDIVEFPSADEAGTIFIDSQPRGARILLDNATTFKSTPDSLTNLSPGVYLITLRLNSFSDTTLIVDLKAGTRPFLDVKLRQQ